MANLQDFWVDPLEGSSHLVFSAFSTPSDRPSQFPRAYPTKKTNLRS